MCTGIKGIFNNCRKTTEIAVDTIIPKISVCVKKKESGGGSRRRKSLLAEGLAVGALVHGGILLMGAHQDFVQRAVVLGIAVVSAGCDGAFDALVGIAVHLSYLLLFGFALSMTERRGFM